MEPDSTSGHQAKADRAPRFRRLYDTSLLDVNLSRPIATGASDKGADHARMARVSRRPGTGQQRPGATSRGVHLERKEYVFTSSAVAESGARLYLPCDASWPGRPEP